MFFFSPTLLSQIMKNIFHQSFNAYKTDIEPRVSELTLHRMQCSRRLFEIMLSHRRISAAYIEGDNIAVTVEGEAVRMLNFDTGKFVSTCLQYDSVSNCKLHFYCHDYCLPADLLLPVRCILYGYFI